jgi:predicted glycosyltransferase
MYPVDASRKVVIAPLDWGLGHATRIIPIIRYLVDSGRSVTVAATPVGINVIRTEFPTLEYLTIPGYAMDYPRNGRYFLLHMIRRLPRLMAAIRREHRWLRDAQRIHRWDLIISDNRYGFRHPEVPSVFITHQLNIRTEISSGVDYLVKKLNHAIIARFDACWIPDQERWPGLAGNLSHGVIPSRARYIGPLSRLTPQPSLQRSGLLIMLSGPEPQRTLIETRILKAMKTYQGKVTLVRGLPDAPGIPAMHAHHTILNHLPAAALGRCMAEAELVICRAGYSSVMDLVHMGTPAVLIPTPGQTEQEYLARHLEHEGYFPRITQEEFTLEGALRMAATFHFRTDKPDFLTHLSLLDEVLPGPQTSF